MTKDRIVYSSEHGRICPECQKPDAGCVCKERAHKAVLGDGDVKLRRETKGRGGKTVVVITGLALDQKQLQNLLSELKRHCGSGGTVKDGTIEVQGEHLEKIRGILIKKGYKPKG